MCSFEAPQFKRIFRNWRGTCRWLSNFLGAYGTDAQGEVEGIGLVYSCEEAAKEQFNSNLQLPEEKLKGDGIKLFSIALHCKTRGNGLESQLWRFIVDERKYFFTRKVEQPWNRQAVESQSTKVFKTWLNRAVVELISFWR